MTGSTYNWSWGALSILFSRANDGVGTKLGFDYMYLRAIRVYQSTQHIEHILPWRPREVLYRTEMWILGIGAEGGTLPAFHRSLLNPSSFVGFPR